MGTYISNNLNSCCNKQDIKQDPKAIFEVKDDNVSINFIKLSKRT